MTLNPVRISGDSKILLLGLTALLISSAAATFAGVFLGSERHILEFIPGLMVLLPPSINMRGSISGVLASRLSSSMHLGVFEVNFKGGNVLGDNLRATFVVTTIIAFVLGFFAYLISILFGVPTIGIVDIVVISVISGIISGLIVTLITLIVSLLSHRYGLDLDMIAAPTVTTSGDIVTLPVLILTAIFVTGLDPMLRSILFGAAVFVAIASVIYSGYSTDQVKSIVKEIVPLLLPLSILGTMAGITYSLDLDRLIAFAAFLILIPPFMGGCGSIGGILCSRLATGMHTGLISPDVIPRREVYPQFLVTYLYSLVLLPLLGVISHMTSGILGIASPGLWLMIGISTGSGLLVITLITLLAYSTASLSFRYGLDPDNFGIPVITSVIDLVGAAVLIAVINILL